MKRVGLALSIVFLMVTAAGCVLSVSPSTSETVVMNPGETQTFTIKTSGTTGYDRKFNIYDASDGLSTDTIEAANFSYKTNDDTLEDTATYTPNGESVGEYKVKFNLTYWSEDTPLSMAFLAYVNAVHSRTWKVVVRGVGITPRQTLSAIPGTTMTYTAAAYPEGDYTYQWLLDGEVVATGATYDLTPTLEQCGTHTLTATAIGEGEVYSLSREIVVPLTLAGGSDSDEAHCIQATPDGGFIVAGQSKSTDIPGTTNHGGEDAYAVKFGSSGAVQWQKLYGGKSWDQAYSIAPTSDGGYIVAGYSGSSDIPGAPLTGFNDMYILKLDSQGEVEWQKLYGSSIPEYTSNHAFAALPTGDGGYIVIGSWVLKLGSQGDVLWQKSEYAGRSLCVDADGGFIIWGKKNDAPGIFKLDSEGIEEWYRPFDARWEFPQGDLMAAGNNSYTAVMNRNDVTTRTYENALAKVTDNGASASSDWTKVFTLSGYADSIEYSTLLPTTAGGYWAVGTTGSDRICVLRLDAGGNPLSAGPRLIGGGLERHRVLDAAIAADGSYLLVDSPTFFWLPGTRDIYVLKLNESAN